MKANLKKDFSLYFTDFNLHPSINDGLKDSGFTEPTPIQEKSIPIILQGKDLIGAAQTGTGKTGAFVIPMLEKIIQNPKERTQALILSPTRELAQQIDEQIFALGYHSGVSSSTVIGGEDFSKQAKAIRSGVDIIVATPGRLIDQMKILDIDFSDLKYLVLDEADRMLDMGFLPDVSKIIKQLPKDRQTLLFSATMPDQIKDLANTYMNDPEKVEIEVSTPAESVEQHVYFVHQKEKLDFTKQLLKKIKWESCIIFMATKRGTDQLVRLLNQNGVDAVSIHGDRSQEERNEALRKFKNNLVPVIVATDVLARGIDIDDVSLIINYKVPRTVEDYIHRIGRTGRYDKTGLAVTLVSHDDKKYYQSIKRKLKEQVQEKKASDILSTEKKERKSVDKSEGKDKASSEQRRRKRRPDPKQNSKTDTPSKQRDIQKSTENRPEKARKVAQKNDEPIVVPERISKATERKRKKLSPSKGLWGLIKSFIPTFKK